MDEKSTSPVAAKGPSSSNKLKRTSDSAPKGRSAKRAKKEESTAPIAKEERGQLNELKQKLRDTELKLKSAQDRIKRLQGKEAHMQKSYDDLKIKSDEAADDFAELKEMKVATINTFLAKWENVNENKQGEDISDWKNVIPLSLCKYFSKEVEKNKTARPKVEV